MGKRVWVVLFAAGLSYAGTPAAADIDATGRWFLSAVPHDEEIDFTEDWTQTGTVLTTSSGFSGSIDPVTGNFSMHQPNPLGLCPDNVRTGTISADGKTLMGAHTAHNGTPSICLFGLTFGFAGSRCGGGLLDVGEECDDGNIDDGDGCSSSCAIESCFGCSGEPSACTQVAAGTPCGLGGPCEALECNSSGDCVSVPDVRICRGAAKSKLLIADRGDDGDKIVWKWLRGASTSNAELADPLSTATYDLCLFAGSPAAVIAEAQVAPNAQDWSAVSDRGYLYQNTGGDGTIRKIVLKNSDSDLSTIIVKAKGANLTELPLLSGTPILVQLHNSQSDACWSSTFDAGDPSAVGKFKSSVP